MKKTGLLIITILLTLAGAGHAFASDTIFTEGLLQYRVEEADDGRKQISITRYYGDDENFQVPWSIGLHEVKHIEEGAFSESPVVRVMLPDNEVAVDDGAFRENQRVSGYRIGEEFHFEDEEDEGGEPPDDINPGLPVNPLNPVIDVDASSVNSDVENGASNTSTERSESSSAVDIEKKESSSAAGQSESGSAVDIEKKESSSVAGQSESSNSGYGSGTGKSSSASTFSINGTVDSEPLKSDDKRDDTSASESDDRSSASSFVEFEIDIPEDEWSDAISAEEVERIKAKKDKMSDPDEQNLPKTGDAGIINGTPDVGRFANSQPEKKAGPHVWLIAALAIVAFGATTVFIILKKRKK